MNMELFHQFLLKNAAVQMVSSVPLEHQGVQTPVPIQMPPRIAWNRTSRTLASVHLVKFCPLIGVLHLNSVDA